MRLPVPALVPESYFIKKTTKIQTTLFASLPCDSAFGVLPTFRLRVIWIFLFTVSFLVSVESCSQVPSLSTATPMQDFQSAITVDDDTSTSQDQAKENRDSKDEIIHQQPKRHGYLSWDDYFLSVALLSSKRSKDPTTASGACIVDKQNRIVGTLPRWTSPQLVRRHQ